MTLNIDQIIERNSYRYDRTIGGKTTSGTGVMIQRYKGKNNQWYIILHDARNKRAPTLRLAHIKGPARVR